MCECLIDLNVCVTADLFRDLSHSFLQIVILLSQSSVLLEKRLADSCSQLQISLFLLFGMQEEKEEKR